MATTVRLNPAGFVQLRNDKGVIKELERVAAGVASRAGAGMEVRRAETSFARSTSRARVAVVTATRAARTAEATSRALTRAVSGGS